MEQSISSIEQAVKIRDASISFETKRAIKKHYNKYLNWRYQQKIFSDINSGEIQYLERYLLDLMENNNKITTIEQAKWAIDSVYKSKGLQQPGNSQNIKTIMMGLRRVLGSKKTKKKALTIDDISSIKFPKTKIGIRDRAILLLGFAGGLRRSELSNIFCQDIEWADFGFRLYLKKSKTNQEGKEEFINVVRAKEKNNCPVNAVSQWMIKAKILEGYLFRNINKAGEIKTKLSTLTIAKKVKWAATKCGFDSKEFSGHSLRAGCATYLLNKNIALHVVSKHLRHKKLETTLQYDRNTTAKILQGIY